MKIVIYRDKTTKKITNHHELLYHGVEKGYKYWQEKAVDLFCEFIKPELKKELNNG